MNELDQSMKNGKPRKMPRTVPSIYSKHSINVSSFKSKCSNNEVLGTAKVLPHSCLGLPQ